MALRSRIRDLVMFANKPVNCSQHVITDFFTSVKPRESDNMAHIPEVDCDLAHFHQLVELKSESIPDLDNVINLSDHVLTIPQHEILNKGLKFCPTPGEAQMGDLRRDLDKYHRSLRLKSHFNPIDPGDLSSNIRYFPRISPNSLKISPKLSILKVLPWVIGDSTYIYQNEVISFAFNREFYWL